MPLKACLIMVQSPQLRNDSQHPYIGAVDKNGTSGGIVLPETVQPTYVFTLAGFLCLWHCDGLFDTKNQAGSVRTYI